MEKVQSKNLWPALITAENAITPESAEILKDLVDERGTPSKWFYNPDCFEYQIANPFSKSAPATGIEIDKVLPELYRIGEQCLRHMQFSFGNSAFDTITGHHGFWVLKYNEGGEFEPHCDWDSGPNGLRPPIVSTASVMLNEGFWGGETIIFDGKGNRMFLERPKYSVVMWDGFTKHQVSPVTEGTRYALVIHYTGIPK